MAYDVAQLLPSTQAKLDAPEPHATADVDIDGMGFVVFARTDHETP